jgi:serine/threonine protein kinase/Flp pilus assembly protein TadD
MVGQEISQFILVERLGSGGMGEVYLAIDKRLDRKVAIKLLSPSHAVNSNAQRHLLREARAAAGLDHPNICTIHEVGEHDGHGYIAMQYVEGETLASVIARNPLSTDQTLSVAIQLSEALAAAHAIGIIHRDIKPHNLMLTPKGKLIVLDFGLATRLAATNYSDSRSTKDPISNSTAAGSTDHILDKEKTLSLTSESGAMVGTIPYMSPEQLRGDPVDQRTDLFSFGSVIHEALTGKRLFGRQTISETMNAILRSEIPEPIPDFTADPKLRNLQAVLTRCLSTERNDRFESAAELAAALREIETQALKSELAGSMPALRSIPRIAKVLAPVLVLIVVLGIVVRSSWNPKAPIANAANAKPTVASIAVLPLKTSTQDASDEYISDGLTVSLINQLSQISTLKVIARNSAFRYKGQEVDPKIVGEQLNVGAVLGGSIEEQGDGVEVSLVLTDTSQNNVLWTKRFTSKKHDVLELQSNILREVTEELRPLSAADMESRSQRRQTRNRVAYGLYLKGLFNLNKRTAAGTMIALESFKEAIKVDPEYALAFAGLADAYSLLDDFYIERGKTSFAKAEEAARKALAIDPTLGEAHSTLALINRDFKLDWPAAEEELKRALELNPNYAITYNRYGWFLISVGRFDEALMHMRKAQELDPDSLNINTAVGLPHFYARRYDKAIEEFQRTLQLNPDFYPANLYLGMAYTEKGLVKEAIKIFQGLRKVDEKGTDTGVCLAHAYVKLGQNNRARNILNELKKSKRANFLPLYDLALIHAQLQQPDEALDLLEKAYAESELSSLVLVEPMLDPLKGNPRFDALMKRLKLTN